MSEPFVMEGKLVFVWQPGGDGWDVDREDLADLVASHFSVESGNRDIGRSQGHCREAR